MTNLCLMHRVVPVLVQIIRAIFPCTGLVYWKFLEFLVGWYQQRIISSKQILAIFTDIAYMMQCSGPGLRFPVEEDVVLIVLKHLSLGHFSCVLLA